MSSASRRSSRASVRRFRLRRSAPRSASARARSSLAPPRSSESIAERSSDAPRLPPATTPAARSAKPSVRGAPKDRASSSSSCASRAAVRQSDREQGAVACRAGLCDRGVEERHELAVPLRQQQGHADPRDEARRRRQPVARAGVHARGSEEGELGARVGRLVLENGGVRGCREDVDRSGWIFPRPIAQRLPTNGERW